MSLTKVTTMSAVYLLDEEAKLVKRLPLEEGVNDHLVADFAADGDWMHLGEVEELEVGKRASFWLRPALSFWLEPRLTTTVRSIEKLPLAEGEL